MTLESPLLSAIPGLRHAFFTREGGVSGGITAASTAASAQRRSRSRRRESPPDGGTLGVTPEHFLSVWQTHSPDVVVTTGPWQGEERPKADAIVTRTEGIAIGATAADCGPVLFVDPSARVIGAAHAGWKGALTGVLESTIEAMERLGAERGR
jgi:copper oxidase (laccase) domain-containing protein